MEEIGQKGSGQIAESTEIEKSEVSKGVGQEQVHELLFGDKLSWQAIIYELINTEQLDPWNIDISLLSRRYLEKVRELEEANFFVSSKVLLAASLLLRIKSEILLNREIPSLDDILFGKKEERMREGAQEKIELDEELPELIPRTPLPRFRRVTLDELMGALGKAIKTETRRIKREIVFRQQERAAEIVAPRIRINVKDKMKEIYMKLKEMFSNNKSEIAFSELAEKTGNDRIASFVSLLHLDNQQKVWLQQQNHLDEIWIWLKSAYEKNKGSIIDEINKKMEELNKGQVRGRGKKIDSGFARDFEHQIEE